MSSVINQESPADGNRRCATSNTLNDADLTSCVTSPDVQIPACSMTYEANNTNRMNDLIIMVYGKDLTEGLQKIGLKPIPMLNQNQSVRSCGIKFADIPWESCEKIEHHVDNTEKLYLDEFNKEMVSFLCSYSFQPECYIDIIFLFNPVLNIKINLCEVKIYVRV